MTFGVSTGLDLPTGIVRRADGAGSHDGQGKHRLLLPPDSERVDRTEFQMAEEAAEIRAVLFRLLDEEKPNRVE